LAKIKPGRGATTKPINVQYMHTDNTYTYTDEATKTHTHTHRQLQ